MFKILLSNCCGLDVHKTWIFACIGITDKNNRTVYHEARFPAVTIYLPHVRGSQPQARDISLPKLYNGRAMVWRDSPRAARS